MVVFKAAGCGAVEPYWVILTGVSYSLKMVVGQKGEINCRAVVFDWIVVSDRCTRQTGN